MYFTVPLDYNLIQKNNHIYFLKENDKIIIRKTNICPFGMKCTNIKCVDHHHPVVDLDILTRHKLKK